MAGNWLLRMSVLLIGVVLLLLVVCWIICTCALGGFVLSLVLLCLIWIRFCTYFGVLFACWLSVCLLVGLWCGFASWFLLLLCDLLLCWWCLFLLLVAIRGVVLMPWLALFLVAFLWLWV